MVSVHVLAIAGKHSDLTLTAAAGEVKLLRPLEHPHHHDPLLPPPSPPPTPSRAHHGPLHPTHSAAEQVICED